MKKQNAIHYSIWTVVHTEGWRGSANSARESRYANLQFILLKQQIGLPDDNALHFLIQLYASGIRDALQIGNNHIDVVLFA